MAADPAAQAELECLLQTAQASVKEGEEILAEFPAKTPTVATVRRLTNKLHKQSELLGHFKPARNKEDVHDYATKVVPIKVKIAMLVAELTALDQPEPSSTQRTSGTASVAPAALPRNLEIQVPIFNGDYDEYPAFIEESGGRFNSLLETLFAFPRRSLSLRRATQPRGARRSSMYITTICPTNPVTYINSKIITIAQLLEAFMGPSCKRRRIQTHTL